MTPIARNTPTIRTAAAQYMIHGMISVSYTHLDVYKRQIYDGANTLYKDQYEGIYILALTQSDHSTADFNRICNMLSEYGSFEKGSGASLAYLEEHCEKILSPDAVQKLALL